MLIRPLAAALLVGLLVSGLLPGFVLAAPPPRVEAPKGGPPRVTDSLISDAASVEPGSTFWVGLRQRIAPGWHTYWINPGDSGEPPSIEWKLPEGFAAGPIVWPRPDRLKVGPFMSFGYEREVVLPIYGATNTPHMYVVDKTGMLVYAGAIDDRPTTRRADVQGANNYVRAALDSVTAGQPVKTPVTRAYGCTVKYS